MSIASELLTLNTAKQNIKQAIMDKRVDMAGVPFTNYHAKIAEIEGGGGEEAYYTRPADWLPLPAISAGDQKVALLVPVFEENNYAFNMVIAGNCTIDWGDGTVENYTGSTSDFITHTYNWTDIPASTLCARGYRQAIITVTPQDGANLTYLKFGREYYPDGVRYLDVKISAPYCATSGFNSCQLLEQIEWIGTNVIKNFSAFFQSCYSLQNIVSLDTSPATTFQNAFSYCKTLKTIPSLDTSNVTNFKECFDECYSLKTIPPLDTSNVTNFEYAFAYCYSLESLPSLNFNAATNLDSAFYRTYCLKKFDGINIGVTVYFEQSNLGVEELVKVFTNLKNVTSKPSISITGNRGADLLTAAQRAIATDKGWTIV